MKRQLLASLSVLVALALSGCGGSAAETPQRVATNFLSLYVSGRGAGACALMTPAYHHAMTTLAAAVHQTGGCAAFLDARATTLGATLRHARITTTVTHHGGIATAHGTVSVGDRAPFVFSLIRANHRWLINAGLLDIGVE